MRCSDRRADADASVDLPEAASDFEADGAGPAAALALGRLRLSGARLGRPCGGSLRFRFRERRASSGGGSRCATPPGGAPDKPHRDPSTESKKDTRPLSSSSAAPARARPHHDPATVRDPVTVRGFDMRDPATVRGFAAALSGLPRLARLFLYLFDSDLSSGGASALGPEQVAALLASAGARRAVTTLLHLSSSATGHSPRPTYPSALSRCCAASGLRWS
eukprot:tig00000093_g3525.t1